MATPTITMTVVTNGNTYTRTKTISTADLSRFLNAYKAILGKVSDGAGGLRDMTNQECALAWMDGLFAGSMANIKNQEKAAASKTAGDAVIDIVLT